MRGGGFSCFPCSPLRVPYLWASLGSSLAFYKLLLLSKKKKKKMFLRGRKTHLSFCTFLCYTSHHPYLEKKKNPFTSDAATLIFLDLQCYALFAYVFFHFILSIHYLI